MSNAIQLFPAKAAEEAEHRKRMNELVIHKQRTIERLTGRLQGMEITDDVAFMLMEFHSVITAIWSIGKAKREHDKNRRPKQFEALELLEKESENHE